MDIVKVAAWLGDTVKIVYDTYAHFMPDTDDRGRKAINAFFEAIAEGSCESDVQQGRGCEPFLLVSAPREHFRWK